MNEHPTSACDGVLDDVASVSDLVEGGSHKIFYGEMMGVETDVDIRLEVQRALEKGKDDIHSFLSKKLQIPF
jgi:hypothetical protein